MPAPFDPERHHRGSIRLTGHDYAEPGSYFVTICIHDRSCLFGEIVDGEGVLSEPGLMVESWWGNIQRRFPSVLIGPYVVMPNHFHGIVMPGAVAGSDMVDHGEGDHIGSPLRTRYPHPMVHGDYEEFVGTARRGRPAANHSVSPEARPSLSDVVGWFKTMTTWDYGNGVRDYGWPPYRGRLWQRGFYDHVVRTDADLTRINDYIESNPARWADDDLYPT